MKKKIKIAYDKEADILEVIFEIQTGYWKDTERDAILAKVDADGNVIGFGVRGVSALDHPLYLTIDNKNMKVSSLSFDNQRILEKSMKRNEELMKKLSKM